MGAFIVVTKVTTPSHSIPRVLASIERLTDEITRVHTMGNEQKDNGVGDCIVH